MKFNDYFEFPREFNMAPYTAATLAKLEGGVCSNCQQFLPTHLLFCKHLTNGPFQL